MTGRQAAQMLAQRGLRPTQQRIAVYQYLMEHPVHPTADMIFEAVRAAYPTFSRTTIYNSLHALADAGLIRTVTMDAEEQRFDGNPRAHAHFKCSACGHIYDFDVDEPALRRICPSPFAVEDSAVYFTGCCPSCQKKEQAV